MPETKPGIVLDTESICQACKNHERRKSIDYDNRFEELKQLTEKYKRNDGSNDCIVTVSGGKDSHFQVYVLKELLGMNPLLVTVSDPFSKTEAGRHNFQNIADAFGCDIITLNQNPDLVRRMMRIAFEEFGSPNWPIDQAIYAFPIKIAIKLGIPLIFYGENVSYEYGGVLQEETYSAKDQIKNDVAKTINWDFWYKKGISKQEINMLLYPTEKEIEESNLDPVYLSYFIPWDGYKNYQIATRYGFRNISNEWKRDGFIEDYDQVDSVGYLVHPWLKYPKFGFARATDVAGYWIRSGRITKEDGIRLIREHDYKIDQRALDDFLAFTGYTNKEFWDVVEKFWNKDIFEKVDGVWKLKEQHLL
jgi:N-acetyl sugar amidotransferase